MSFRKSTANWQWRYFAAPGIPDVLEGFEGFLENEITMADGSKLQAKPFEFAPEGVFNFYDVAPEIAQFDKLNAAGRVTSPRTILVGEFVADAPGRVYVGLGADWKWTFWVNGKMLLDARLTANSEAPVRANNHSLEIEYVAGRNQIIFEVFGGTYRHPGLDGGMNVALEIIEGMPALEIVYKPFVTFPDAYENAVTIDFSANRKSPAAVEYRVKGSDSWTRVYDNLGGQMRRDRAVHCIRLEDLQPATEYEYRAVLVDDFRMLEDFPQEVHTFKTAAPKGTDFSFFATADLQNPATRNEYMERIVGNKAPFKSDFFTFIGDLYWTTDYNRSVMDEFIVPFTEMAGDKMPLVMVRGNHEIYGKESNRFFEYFTAPYPGREGYYMFSWGDVCFIVLDFCDDEGNVPPPSTRQFHDFEPYIAAEAKWLKRAINDPVCRDAKYRIVLAHGVPVGDACEYMPGHIRQVIDPVFGGKDPLCKIHLWLGGHVHRPLRSIPFCNAFYSMQPLSEFRGGVHAKSGVNYSFPVVVTGGPRATLGENLQFTGIKVDVTAEKLTVSSLDRYNEMLDQIEIAADGSVKEIFRTEEMKYYEY